MNEERKVIDRETKIMLLGVLKCGYFEQKDFDLLAQKYGSHSISVERWITNELLSENNRETAK